MEIGSIKKPYTHVPPKNTLSPEKIYYVYEWFIKDTDEIFYVGKGKGNRIKIKQRKGNPYFAKVRRYFETDVRIVKDGLSEYDAYLFEEDYILYLIQIGINTKTHPLFGYIW